MTDLSLPPSVTVSPTIVGVSVLTDDGVTVQVVVAKSELIAETIIAAATKNNCDLIVMASHGRKGLKRVLLGSETQHVLTHSHIPVLVLR